jgi:serine/threonine protein phosphatase PrpC
VADLTGKIEIASASDPGLKRSHNEDSCGYDMGLGLAVLADGMGGYKAGEVASAIAVASVMKELRDDLAKLKPRQIDEESGYSMESLAARRAIQSANTIIFDTANNESQCQGMGTTVILMLFYDDRFTVAHVGDSRLYRLRGDTLSQITSDHSLVQELVDRGFFTAEEAEANTPRNLVTRALGIDRTVEVDIKEEMVLPGDIYLMCSDGLHDMVKDEEIHLTLSKYSANLVEAAAKLVSLANKNGGDDNISILLMRPSARFPAEQGLISRLFSWIR